MPIYKPVRLVYGLGVTVSDKTLREVMAQLGRKTSKKKAKASRENGKKGGRPKKKRFGLVRG